MVNENFAAKVGKSEKTPLGDIQLFRCGKMCSWLAVTWIKRCVTIYPCKPNRLIAKGFRANGPAS
jgi:hypothetical protein